MTGYPQAAFRRLRELTQHPFPHCSPSSSSLLCFGSHGDVLTVQERKWPLENHKAAKIDKKLYLGKPLGDSIMA